MRLIVFFDLPVQTAAQRREYAKFRKYLVKNGYLMMQESVYSKLAIDGRMIEMLVSRLRENRPPEGLVQALQVTEKQYAEMFYIMGARNEISELETTESLVVL
ncbi:MAG: CRISPR-associated endonuclease Cas2 [Coriobacteriales bacterium]|nr:CRISPR-associated endonuclease Cas2 [Coriobacteriales bacterium]